MVEATLRELDPETVLILTLRDLEGLSYRELEALLDLPSRHREVAHPPRSAASCCAASSCARRRPGKRAARRQVRRASRPSAFLEVVPC